MVNKYLRKLIRNYYYNWFYFNKRFQRKKNLGVFYDQVEGVYSSPSIYIHIFLLLKLFKKICQKLIVHMILH